MNRRLAKPSDFSDWGEVRDDALLSDVMSVLVAGYVLCHDVDSDELASIKRQVPEFAGPLEAYEAGVPFDDIVWTVR